MGTARLFQGSPERLVLNFHGLGVPPGWVGPEEAPFWCEVPQFESILDAIGPVSDASRLPIELTFDDGNLTDATIALPALRARGLTAAFFVCAGRIGQEGYLDEPAIQEIVGSGMPIGSHGWAHVDWRRVDEQTLDLEVNQACERLSAVVGSPVDTVAIPFGSYDARVLRRLNKRGIRTVFTSDGGRASRQGRIVPRETYQTWWTDRTLSELTNRPVSLKARLRRSAVQVKKRLI